MANVEQALPRKGPSFAIQIAVLLAMTGAAIGMGWLSGAYLKGGEGPKPVPVAPENQGKVETKSEGAHKPDAGPTLVSLAPITTSLASPADIWIRMEVAILYDAPQPLELSEQIHQDFLALIRTLKMHQMESASGFQHLKADLQERAVIRGGGHVKEVLIRTLLFE